MNVSERKSVMKNRPTNVAGMSGGNAHRLMLFVAGVLVAGLLVGQALRADVSSASQEPAAVTFAVIGDFGSNDANELDVANLVKSWTPDFIITVGDNNYPDGEASTMDANVGKYYQ